MNTEFSNSDPVDLLGNIRQTDLPPFLLTRILAKLEDPAYVPAKPRTVLIWSLALALLIGLNLTALNRRQYENHNSGNDFGLNTNYSLYSND